MYYLTEFFIGGTGYFSVIEEKDNTVLMSQELLDLDDIVNKTHYYTNMFHIVLCENCKSIYEYKFTYSKEKVIFKSESREEIEEMIKHLPNTLSCGEWVPREYLDKNKYYIGTYDTLEDIHNDYLRIEQACEKLSILFELEK